MSELLRYILDLGLEISKDRIKDAISEKEVRGRLTAYLEHQKDVNFICTREEELDFQGLFDYIRHDLIDDARAWLRGNKRERGDARKTIRSKAIAYSRANTKLSEKRAVLIVEEAMTILYGYYRSKINKELLFLVGEVEDTIEGNAEKLENSLSEKFSALSDEVKRQSLLSVDRNIELVKAKRFSEIQDNLTIVLDTISSKHDLRPHYGFRMTADNKLISFPLTKDAEKLYPPSFHITVSAARLGADPIDNLNQEVFDRAYRRQLPIYFDKIKAEKYLGNIPDPIQSEAEEIERTGIYLRPPAFPPAMLCCITLNDEVYFPTILIRTKEIKDDHTFIISNEEQEDRHIDVTIRLNFVTSLAGFEVHKHSMTSRELLNYYRFIKRADEGAVIAIKLLSTNEPLVSGKIEHIRDETDDVMIEFLEKIVSIEEYFDTNIDVPNEITVGDNKAVNYLYSLISEESYSQEWNKFSVDDLITEESRKALIEIPDTDMAVLLSLGVEVEIFNKTFSLRIKRTYECARVDNIARLKEKARVLDIGDTIKVGFVPGNGSNVGKYIDIISKDSSLEADQATS